MYDRTNPERLSNRRSFLKSIGVVTTAAALGQLLPANLMAAEGSEGSKVAALYKEKHRPQFHFTPKKNWTNDPNGLVYYKGQYHLFFQHNPFGIDWGNMTWGHAVSRNMIHWKQLDNAIEPDGLGTIFSGSAVVDWNNTSGLQTGDENVLIAFYTAAGKFAKPEKKFTQCLAYSNDRGKTWIKYKGNPIVGNIANDDDRDPKVIWHKPTGKWVMVLFLDKDNEFAILTSSNLIDWQITQTLTLEGSRECPDFFELPVDGNPNNTRWVFWGGNGKYLLGGFDGKKFTPQAGPFASVVGNHYAAQTWSDIPETDGRRLQIAWMAKGKFPGMPFNQQMSIPCELTLRTLPKGIRLCHAPVREIKKLRGAHCKSGSSSLKPGIENPVSGVTGDLFEIQTVIDLGTMPKFTLVLRGNELVYDAKEQKLSCRGKEVKVAPIDGKIKLQILIDRTSIEIFANDGRASMFLCFPLDTENTSLAAFANEGVGEIAVMDIWKLKSIWRRR